MELLKTWGPLLLALASSIYAAVLLPWRLRKAFESIVDNRTAPEFRLVRAEMAQQKSEFTMNYVEIVGRLDGIEQRSRDDNQELIDRIERVSTSNEAHHAQNTALLHSILTAVQPVARGRRTATPSHGH